MTLANAATSAALDENASMGSSERSARAALGGAGEKGSGMHGEKELFYRYTARLFSALPVRQAYLRLLRLDNNYDRMTADEKQEFDARFSSLAAEAGSDIVVSVDFDSNHRETLMEVNRQLRQATRDTLDQRAYLISDRVGRVNLKDYVPPSADGTGAKLIFPRQINGEPVVGTQDKQVKLEFVVPGSGHKVYIVWKVADLTCNGQLVL